MVSGCRQEMARSTFGLALSAQLIDLPPKNTHSNASVLHMTNIKINFHKKIFDWIEASKTGPPQILCEIEINKEDAL